VTPGTRRRTASSTSTRPHTSPAPSWRGSSAGLVSKLWSSFTAKGVPDDYSDYEGSTFIVDTRYTGWGSKVSVKAPNPKTVTDKLTS
jgi:hypothetical protein